MIGGPAGSPADEPDGPRRAPQVIGDAPGPLANAEVVAATYPVTEVPAGHIEGNA